VVALLPEGSGFTEPSPVSPSPEPVFDDPLAFTTGSGQQPVWVEPPQLEPVRSLELPQRHTAVPSVLPEPAMPVAEATSVTVSEVSPTRRAPSAARRPWYQVLLVWEARAMWAMATTPEQARQWLGRWMVKKS
jgi:hypothetical protein